MKIGKKSKMEMFRPGRIGNLVFYERYGTKCVRIHTPHIKQTDPTKAAATVFGRAVVYAKHLRRAITPIMHDENDRAIMYTMNRAVQSWLRTKPDLTVSHDKLKHLHGLSINKFWRIKFKIDVDWSQPGKVVVKIPAFHARNDFAGKSGTTHIIWKLAVTGVTTAEHPRPVKKAGSEFCTRYGDLQINETVIELPYTSEPGTINIVALALHLCFDPWETRQRDKVWEPAGILAAWYQG